MVPNASFLCGTIAGHGTKRKRTCGCSQCYVPPCSQTWRTPLRLGKKDLLHRGARMSIRRTTAQWSRSTWNRSPLQKARAPTHRPRRRFWPIRSTTSSGSLAISVVDGTTNAYNSVVKWIVAALKHHGKAVTDLVLLPSYDPNDSLCADIHWTCTTGRDAGIVDSRPVALERTPPQDCLVKTRGWLARYVNQRGAEQKVSLLLERWARNLACVKADARQVNKTTKQVKAASGTLYHHKHDMAPTQEQLNSMTCIGFSGDQRCHANTLDALEAGMAIGLYRCSWKHSRRCTCSPLAMRRLKTRRVALRSNVSR